MDPLAADADPATHFGVIQLLTAFDKRKQLGSNARHLRRPVVNDFHGLEGLVEPGPKPRR